MKKKRRKKKKKNRWDEVIRIMEKLRGKNGCSWDKEQTHHSLTPYLIEESYEVLEAIEEKKTNRLCEELGDLLLQVIFHAQIAQESGKFDINDVLEGIILKIKRRHPHVFMGKKIKTSAGVIKEWEKIKLEEKGIFQRYSLMDGIPNSLPSLLAAERIQMRAAEVGFDWPDVRGVLEKIIEEAGELSESFKRKDILKIKEELGDLLFALVNFARFSKINADEALRMTIKKFVQRFKYMEEVSGGGEKLSKMELEEMDKFWEEAKRHKIKMQNCKRKGII